jgi:hypothetical protein
MRQKLQRVDDDRKRMSFEVDGVTDARLIELKRLFGLEFSDLLKEAVAIFYKLNEEPIKLSQAARGVAKPLLVPVKVNVAPARAATARAAERNG